MSPFRWVLSISQQSDHQSPIPQGEKSHDPTVTYYHCFLLLSVNAYILSFMGPTFFIGNKSSRHEGNHMVSDVAQRGKCHLNTLSEIQCVFPHECLPWLYHCSMIHHSPLLSSVGSLVSPSAVCFTDVMTSFALGTISHTESMKP